MVGPFFPAGCRLSTPAETAAHPGLLRLPSPHVAVQHGCAKLLQEPAHLGAGRRSQVSQVVSVEAGLDVTQIGRVAGQTLPHEVRGRKEAPGQHCLLVRASQEPFDLAGPQVLLRPGRPASAPEPTVWSTTRRHRAGMARRSAKAAPPSGVSDEASSATKRSGAVCSPASLARLTAQWSSSGQSRPGSRAVSTPRSLARAREASGRASWQMRSISWRTRSPLMVAR